MSSALSLADIKDLIVFARAQKIITLEHDGLRFQFNPLAHEREPDPPKKNAKTPPENPFGHFNPEE